MPELISASVAATAMSSEFQPPAAMPTENQPSATMPLSDQPVTTMTPSNQSTTTMTAPDQPSSESMESVAAPPTQTFSIQSQGAKTLNQMCKSPDQTAATALNHSQKPTMQTRKEANRTYLQNRNMRSLVLNHLNAMMYENSTRSNPQIHNSLDLINKFDEVINQVSRYKNNTEYPRGYVYDRTSRYLIDAARQYKAEFWTFLHENQRPLCIEAYQNYTPPTASDAPITKPSTNTATEEKDSESNLKEFGDVFCSMDAESPMVTLESVSQEPPVQELDPSGNTPEIAVDGNLVRHVSQPIETELEQTVTVSGADHKAYDSGNTDQNQTKKMSVFSWFKSVLSYRLF